MREKGGTMFDNTRTTYAGAAATALAIISVMGLLTAAPVFAASPDFRITDFAETGTPSLTVEGTAGGTVPTETGDIYAYVFVTDAGIFAVTSHPGIEDSTEVGDDVNWHAHQVTLDSNNCVTSINDNGIAVLSGDTVSVTGTSATSTSQVLTVVLSVNDEGDICVKHVFDSLS
jgi:hypothetical protein